MRLILASRDPVAIDTVHACIVGVDPEKEWSTLGILTVRVWVIRTLRAAKLPWLQMQG